MLGVLAPSLHRVSDTTGFRHNIVDVNLLIEILTMPGYSIYIYMVPPGQREYNMTTMCP